MKTNFEDVLQAISVWGLTNAVKATKSKNKAVLEINGIKTAYPYWLAVQKIGLMGADQGTLDSSQYSVL